MLMLPYKYEGRGATRALETRSDSQEKTQERTDTRGTEEHDCFIHGAQHGETSRGQGGEKGILRMDVPWVGFT